MDSKLTISLHHIIYCPPAPGLDLVSLSPGAPGVLGHTTTDSIIHVKVSGPRVLSGQLDTNMSYMTSHHTSDQSPTRASFTYSFCVSLKHVLHDFYVYSYSYMRD